jgi:hypothetical protein
MFEQIEEPEEKKPTDYSGTIIGLMLLPVFFFFVYLGRAEMGFTVALVLGMILLAIKLQWRLRKYVWFWATIAVVLAFHIPLFFIVRWPDSKTPTIAYSMPFGILDFLIISGAILLSKNLFLKNSSSDDDEQ